MKRYIYVILFSLLFITSVTSADVMLNGGFSAKWNGFLITIQGLDTPVSMIGTGMVENTAIMTVSSNSLASALLSAHGSIESYSNITNLGLTLSVPSLGSKGSSENLGFINTSTTIVAVAPNMLTSAPLYALYKIGRAHV